MTNNSKRKTVHAIMEYARVLLGMCKYSRYQAMVHVKMETDKKNFMGLMYALMPITTVLLNCVINAHTTAAKMQIHPALDKSGFLRCNSMKKFFINRSNSYLQNTV